MTDQNPINNSLYEYADLSDEEIIAREKYLKAEAAKGAEKERKRWDKARNFRFSGGML